MKKLLVAAVAAAMLLLTGCGENPNLAVSVNGAQTSVAQVDAQAKAVASALGGTEKWASYRALVVGLQIENEFAKVASQRTGISVSDAERQKVYASAEAVAALAKDPATTDLARIYADFSVLQSQAKVQAILPQLLKEIPVVVNQQFGTWDATNGGLSGTGSLSQTLTTPQS